MLYRCRPFAQQQTRTFGQQKFGLFFLKYNAEFNELRLQISKIKKIGNGKKRTITKIVWINAYIHLSEAKGSETGQDSMGIP